MSLLTSLLVLIVVARLLGQIFQRFNQPAIVGEMLAGIFLGPSVLNLIQANTALAGISELAIFLVVLSAGLEMNFKDILNALRGRGVVIAVLGFIIPLAGGILVGTAFQLDVMRTVFLGLCVSITALPVTVRILQSFNLLDSDIARYSVATAILNDVVALLALGAILNLPEHRSFHSVGISIISTSWKLIALGSFILGCNWFLKKLVERGVHLKKISERIVNLLGNEALFGILVLFVLAFGSISEALGFHFVIGAFFGALLIDRKYFFPSRYNELDHTLRSVSEGFLAPVFFAYLGLEFNIFAMKPYGFVITVLAVSIGSKILAGWLGGILIQLSHTRSLGIGIILNGRGVMELVIANIAYERGFIGQDLFSTLVLMGVVTTIITPLLFRKLIIPKLEADGRSEVS
ncbi:MAG TPA: cation:proton antiporter [Desulfobulbaceae bacterium]|nr:cation:proton antiporter [Desulfobulbaceae bacterium]